MSLKLLININQWLNVVCTHDAVPHPCSGQKLFRLTHPQLPSISSPSTIRQAMPCILKNTVCISSPYVVVACMYSKHAVLIWQNLPCSQTAYMPHVKAHWWLPHNQYWTIPSFPGHLLHFFLITYVTFCSLFLTECVTFQRWHVVKKTAWEWS